ncbi:PEGA domain-containing protein [Terrimonas pollutisoli]|uniref:PEGA domain-containing protein n=1 Tax=Terrimonas pollutisoli TaxID=3034147 RepID=UPI0023EDA96F|nr:PEGA domain-containing protein [Terrimonas sp. H1YJ31]
MTHFKRFLFVIPVILLFPGCASIVSKSSWPFSVTTEPEGARVSITNKRGREVFRGKTPVAMKLKSGAGFFAKESYTITLQLNGYETKKINVECKLNGWYFGNILIGGLLGFLIIDPATGAMYKLENDGIIETLDRTSDAGNASLKILDKNQLNEKQQQNLVRIN